MRDATKLVALLTMFMLSGCADVGAAETADEPTRAELAAPDAHAPVEGELSAQETETPAVVAPAPTAVEMPHFSVVLSVGIDVDAASEAIDDWNEALGFKALTLVAEAAPSLKNHVYVHVADNLDANRAGDVTMAESVYTVTVAPDLTDCVRALAHSFGHVLGGLGDAGHSDVKGSLMYPVMPDPSAPFRIWASDVARVNHWLANLDAPTITTRRR